MGQPFIKFFGADWRSDPALRMCSAAARGVWIDCLTIMIEAEPYGHLIVNGRPATAEQIAALTVTPVAVVRKALKELIDNGVCSQTEDGVIYSRRLVRDAERRAKAQQFGRQGGNPALKRKDKPNDDEEGITDPDNPNDNPHDKGEGYGPGLRVGLRGWDNTHGNKPESRSQNPEARSQKPDSETAAARAVIEAFDQARVEVFGEQHRRPWPAGTDLTEAIAMVRANASVELCRHAFETVFRRQKASGKEPANSLRYMRDAVLDAVRNRPPDIAPEAPIDPERKRAEDAYCRALERWARLSADERERKPKPKPSDFGLPEVAKEAAA